MTRYAFLWVIPLFVIGSGPAAGEAGPDSDPVLSPRELALSLPLDCRLTETCWVANYVDVNPGAQAQDFHCQPRTYDGHDGVDFAIRDLDQMHRGVSVIAAVSGTVRAIRNDMEDVLLEHDAAGRSITGRECGNGVVMDHDGGWQTQYCHLRRDSVRVRVGERVARGSELGLVGISGKTTFPHLHLTVRHNGKIVDPFTGLGLGAGCRSQGRSLWAEPQSIPYEEVALYNLGLSDEPPRIADIRRGQARQPGLDRTAQRLVLWVDLFGVQKGDRVRLRITGPHDQSLLDYEQVIDRTRARQFLFAGRSRTAPEWVEGLYNGEVILRRTHPEKVFTTRATTSMFLK
ncbi:M23 family metallopeptidase [Nitrospira tepida]|uniref:M23 family metallopeptidase n=1 Tax=Nitrospira tepida TaxID=2973512 RepID=UPI00259C8C8A|nr:M23 family metallopeptidase [Nitrospira tepida]